MNKSVMSVVSFRQGARLSRPALALCLCLSPFAQATAGADTADAGATAAPESGETSSRALQEVVISAQRTTVEQARKAQEEAPNLINIQTYAEIKKLPDISTAEAVRRIPGVSLETDEGEGRYVNIRGIDADLNSTTFGGLRLPPTNNASPFGGYRAVTLDSIPIGLVGAITVTKTNLPSQDAEALGGTIEITPKTAPTSGAPFLEGQVGSGYQPLRRKPVFDVSLSGGGRFGGAGRPGGTATDAYSDHPFSVVATATFYEDFRGIDDVEPSGYFNDAAHPYHAVNNLNTRDYELNRKRHGWGLEFGWEPNTNTRYYIRGFEAGYNERYYRQYQNLTPDGNTTQAPDGTLTDTLGAASSPPVNNAIQMALRDEREVAKDQVFMAGGVNHFGESVLDYRAGYAKGSWYKPYDYNSAFSYTPAVTNALWVYNLNGRGNTPLYTIPGADYLNPAHYLLNGFANSSAYNFDREWSFVTNFELPVSWGGFDFESLKMGLSGRWRKKEETYYPTSYPTLPNILLSSIAVTPYETYYEGQYKNPPDIPPGYLQTLLGPGTQAPSDVITGYQNYLSAKEDVYAAYIMYQMRVGRFGIVGGVRVENTRDDLNAYQTSKDAAGNPCCALPINAKNSFTDVFPGIQTRFEIQPNLIARATWSSTLARPGFNQLTPSQFVDLGSGLVTTGNPNLKPAKSNSFDATLEWYLPEAGILSFGLFDKELSNYIVADNTGNQVVYFHGQNILLHSYTFSNSSGAYSRGAEFSYDQRFSWLPGWLAGFGINANYTWVDSRFEIRPGEHSTLPSSSKNTWNVALFYQYAGLDVRLAAYSVSPDLFGIGSGKSSDVWNDKRTFMDFGSSYAFSEHWSMYFNVKNLLNTPHTFYLGTPDRPIQREFYRETYLLGVRLNF
jgi:TonB-dependent receptor